MRIALAAGLVTVSIAIVSSAFGAETIKEVRELKVATAPGLALTVKTSNGGIEIVPTDSSEMHIKATVSAKSRERLAAVHVVATNDATKGNEVHVDFPTPVKGEEEGCSLVIEVPRAKNVTLVASNGGLAISGTSGIGSFETSNGGITVKNHDGPATMHSSNGPIMAALSGKAAIKTSNAPVTLTGAAQPFKIETTNGPVDVSLASSFGGTISMITSNGKIAFPKDAKVESQSGNKGYGDAAAKIFVGSGSDASTIQSSNGPVSVRAASH
ncbi:MAG: hypothetical protein ACREJD_09805 [Phycisphaerales bacterium]